MDELKVLPVDEVVSKVGVARAIGIKHVASLLFTYRCTISCKHCLFNCSPDQPSIRVSFEDGVEFLRQLRATDRVVHIAGGEPMIYYDEMLRICQAAHKEEVSPHFIETNASWCVSDEVARKRYEELRDAGIKGMLISTDPYHQAFVLPDRFERARRWAVEIFGEENVIAADPSRKELERMVEIGRGEALLAEYTRKHTPRLVGRAGEELVRFLPDRPIEELKEDSLWHGNASGSADCRKEFDPQEMWEIHIDPYGNIQTCCGIIIGNARQIPLPEMMKRGFTKNELIRIVYEEGPFGLLKLAVKLGYKPREGYPQKCNLCWEVRKYLRPYFPGTFGPEEIYDRYQARDQ
jgi:hypothetical protein